MSKNEVIIYLSEAYKSELYKTLVLSGGAGFLGGAFSSAIQRKFTEVVNSQSPKYVRVTIGYICDGLFVGLGSAILTYSFFMSYYSWSIELIETINKSSVCLALLSPMILTIIINIGENIFRQD